MPPIPTLVTLLVLLTIGATTTRAQSPSPGPAATWSASAGYETFALRDISRNGRPPDASPVSWRGDGPSVIGRYERAAEKSSHVARVTFAQFGRFEYVSPARTVAAAVTDAGSRFEATYEHRRYFWRDLGVRGLDLGLGVQGIVSRLSLERSPSSATSTATRTAGGGFAGVVAVNFDRWERLHLRAAWGNGAVVSRRHTEHTADSLASVSAGGGHWLTDLSAGADWQLAAGLRLTTAWQLSTTGYSSSHLSFFERRQSLIGGIVYAR